MRTPIHMPYVLIAMVPMLSGSVGAITVVPTWDGDPSTTYASYTFTTNSRTAPPEDVANDYGSPTLLVEDDQIFGTGWQDPNEEFQLTRVPGQGAWDLGRFGKLSITVPITSSGDLSPKDLEVFVHLIWYLGPVSTPGFSILGFTPDEIVSESELVETDGAGSWRRTVWQATLSGFSPDSVTMVFQAPSNGSVIDSVSVYTLIPEPSSSVLLAIAGVGLALRRNRSV